MTTLEQLLKEMVVAFPPPTCPVERIVVERGRVWTAQPLPKGFKRGKPKQCFMNAALLAGRNIDTLRYVEGIAYRIIPIHHAWCVDAQGNVIDPTWDDPQESEYMGIAIPHKLLWAELKRTGHYGVLTTEKSGINFAFIKKLKATLPVPTTDSTVQHESHHHERPNTT